MERADRAALVGRHVPDEALPGTALTVPLDLRVGELLTADLATKVAALEALAAAITAEQPAEHTGRYEAPALTLASVRIRRAVERLAAQRLGWLAAIESDGRWAVDAFRAFAQWVAWWHGCSVATARREVMLARTLRDELPATAAAARAGDISSDHVRILSQIAATSDARRRALAAVVPVDEDGPTDENEPSRGSQPPSGRRSPETRTGEQVLVDLAAVHRPEPFRRMAQHFAALADPEAADRAFADAAEREFVDLSATLGG